jgi:hypothetical protein
MNEANRSPRAGFSTPARDYAGLPGAGRTWTLPSAALLFVVATVFAGVAGLGILTGAARAQGPGSAAAQTTKRYTKNPQFLLPFRLTDAEKQTVREVKLFVKTPSEPWTCRESATPAQTQFAYRATQDGEYWFNIVIVDREGHASPDVTQQPPALVVVVDTTPPELQLSLQGQNLRCEVRDANPDPSTMRVEGQKPDKSWSSLEAVPGSADLFKLPDERNWTGLVRAVVKDRAGNQMQKELTCGARASTVSTPPVSPPSAVSTPVLPVQGTVTQPMPGPAPSLPPAPYTSPGTNPGMLPPPPPLPVSPTSGTIRPLEDAGAPSLPVRTEVRSEKPAASHEPSNENSGRLTPVAGQSTSQVTIPPLAAPGTSAFAVPGASVPQSGITAARLLNGTHATLEYRLDQVGPSGVSKVEVWITGDQGKTWQRLCEDPDRKSPVEFDLPGEGVFGLTVVVTNGIGLGDPPPTSGEAPSCVLEVDTTPPNAQLTSVRPGTGDQAGSLLINWTANDKNLGDGPVTLYYATTKQGPWIPIVRNQRNEGSYRWIVSPELGWEFLIRIDVADLAGNVTRCETPTPVAVDMSKPKARVLGISTNMGMSRPVAPN